MSLPLSVFIIAKDEADRIGRVIDSVISWADEVIVIDSGSTDDTIALSTELGATVLFRAWEGYGPQKVFGEGVCRNNWVLNIDADEEVSPTLAKEIQSLFAEGKEPFHKSYHIPIKLVTRFADTPSWGAPSNDPIRLYHKAYAGFKDSTVHDSVIFKMPGLTAGKLHGAVHHRSFRSYRHAVEKINFYSSMQAENSVNQGKYPATLRIISEPLFAFLKAYFLRRYILLGVDGFIESIIYAFARTLKLAKTRERWKEKKK